MDEPVRKCKRKERPLTSYFSHHQQVDGRIDKAKKKAEKKEKEKPFRETVEASSIRSDRSAEVLQGTSKGSKPSSGWTRFGATLKNSTSQNVCHHLMHRSIHGASKIKIPSITWKSPSWFELRSSSDRVRCVAWDDMGVLLAAALEDRTVRIYDWDMVVAADFKGRNKRLRQKQAEATSNSSTCFAIEPILTIPVRTQASDLTWNPYKPDELAVVAWPTGTVYLFDLGEVAAWQQQGSRGQPPRRVLVGLKPTAGHEMKIVFVGNGDYAVVSRGDTLVCYCLTSANLTVKWRYRYKNSISCMAMLCRDVVILGTNVGIFALLNWEEMEIDSFSVQARPKIIDEWYSVLRLATPADWVAIREIRVEKTVDCSVNETQWGRHRILWVNSCGWVMSTMLVAPDQRCGRSEIIYSTKPVRYVNAHGEEIETLRQSWSLPLSVVPRDSTDSVICWEKVADVTEVLNISNDQCALGSHLEFLREGKPSLLWWSKSDGQISTIPLSRRRGRPTAIAIHPNHEWLVLGTANHGLYVLNARNKLD